VGVGKTFRRFDPDQILLMPPSLNEWLPEDHLARFVAEVVDEVLDLSAVYADYGGLRGYPPYDPRLMLRLLIYGYTTGVRSSRAIERKCVEDVAFRFLAADQAPDFRSIARFRRRHLDALADLLVQSLQLAQRLGMVKLGRVALDGTKLRANASKHKARTPATAKTAPRPTCPPSWPAGSSAWPASRRPGRRSRPRPPSVPGPRPRPPNSAANSAPEKTIRTRWPPPGSGPPRRRCPSRGRSATSPTPSLGS
jgi:transposase